MTRLTATQLDARAPETEQNNTVFSHLVTWDDIVQEGANLRQERDSFSWQLGDLALYACNRRNPKGGRPSKGNEPYTVSALASAIGEHREVLSRLMALSEFLPPPERETLPPNVSWRHCSEAVRRSGWRPGEIIASAQKDHFWYFIQDYADGQSVRPRKTQAAEASREANENRPTDFERSCRAYHNDVMGLVRIAPSNHARECVRQAAAALAEALEPEGVTA